MADNFRQMEEAADVVSAFVQDPVIEDLVASISGVTEGNTYTNYIWNTTVTGGQCPYGYSWFYSLDGTNYTSASSSSSSLTMQIPSNANMFYLKVTVTSFDNQTYHDFHTVSVHQMEPMVPIISNESSPFKSGISETVSDNTISNQLLSGMQVFPNPTSELSDLRFSLKESCKVTISILDMEGRTVQTIEDKWKQKGNHSIKLNLDNLKSGIYICSISAKSEKVTENLIIN